MATSRTGTSQWLKVSAQALHRAKANGQTGCPHCGVTLNYKNRRARNGAQVDHIIPHSLGGTDDLSNLIIICMICNTSKGNRVAPKIKTVLQNQPLSTSRKW